MKLIEIANAGTLESSDIQIIIEPNENGGIVIELESVVKAQFGEQVEDVITNTLKELGVTKIYEIGPGKVLSGLIKKIDKEIEVENIELI